ncbi:MAG: hypothetical protein HDT47_00890 [Ruminococcaceae bacterium]|nr:hypothetical protein [Oscillospiraceae bacterium]
MLAVIIHYRELCPLAELKLRFTPASFLQCKKEKPKRLSLRASLHANALRTSSAILLRKTAYC